MNKKGSGLDLIYIGLMLVVFSVIVLIGFRIYSGVNAEFQASGDLDTKGSIAMNNIESLYPGIIDNSFLLLALGLAIGVFILASLVRVHPIFFVLYIILMIILVFFCGIFSNIYQGVAEHGDFVAQADQLIFTSHIMEFLPLIVGVLSAILAIVMYKIGGNEY